MDEGFGVVEQKWRPLVAPLDIPIADIRGFIDAEMERVWRPWPGFSDGPRIGAGVGVEWWASTCDSVCHYLWSDIMERWPALDPVVQHGYWNHRYHVWWVLADGSILDPTSQQFPPMPHIALWRMWMAEQQDYDPSPIASAACRPAALARGFEMSRTLGPSATESSREKALRVYAAAEQLLRPPPEGGSPRADT